MEKYLAWLVKKEYERRREAAIEGFKAQQRQMNTVVEGLEDMDRKISLLGLKRSRLKILESVDDRATEAGDAEAKDIDSKIAALKKERQAILLSSGYNPSHMHPIYKCALCRDRGFVESGNLTEKCVCFNDLYYRILYSVSNMGSMKNCRFKNFNEQYYSDKPARGFAGNKPVAADSSSAGSLITSAASVTGSSTAGTARTAGASGDSEAEEKPEDISPRENILSIKEICMDFVKNFDDPSGRNLFFSGSAGTGKTFMAGCVGNELLRKCRMVLYYSAPRMFDVINRYRMNFMKDQACDSREYDYIYNAELLIIDDLGTEAPSGAKFSELLNILNYRGSGTGSIEMKSIGEIFNPEQGGIIIGGSGSPKPRKTIISSNIGVRELYEYYDERIASRIIGGFDVIRFIGEDIRRIIKQQEG